jgi:hypothetical protein
MDRRQAVKTLGAMVGIGLFVPESLLARAGDMLEGEAPKVAFFNKQQRKINALMAEALLPRTDTPGAKDAGVPGWMELLLQDCYDKDQQGRFLRGLTMVEEECQKRTGKLFTKLSKDLQPGILSTMEAELPADSDLTGFLKIFKSLAKFCYVHSEKGATQAFAYLPVPGKWDAAMPLEKGQKVWVSMN